MLFGERVLLEYEPFLYIEKKEIVWNYFLLLEEELENKLHWILCNTFLLQNEI